MIFKLVTRFWKKALYLLITGSTSVFIAACYGMPAGFGDYGYWKIKVRDDEDKPISGLQVTILQFDGNSDIPDTLEILQTDSAGVSTFFPTAHDIEPGHMHQAAIHDIDSTENNGFFVDTTITKAGSELSEVLMRKKQ